MPASVPSVPSIKGKGKAARGIRAPRVTGGPIQYNGPAIIYNGSPIQYN